MSIETQKHPDQGQPNSFYDVRQVEEALGYEPEEFVRIVMDLAEKGELQEGVDLFIVNPNCAEG
jgi:hypothetical protein